MERYLTVHFSVVLYHADYVYFYLKQFVVRLWNLESFKREALKKKKSNTKVM